MEQLVNWLTGEFTNQAQAIADPVWYVHLRLWHRPVPHLDQVLEGRVIFAEQANVINLHKPYRQRLLCLSDRQAKYYAFKQPSLWIGGGAEPTKLTEIGLADLEFLPGCTLPVNFDGNRYTAHLPNDAQCCFNYNDQVKQVILGFAATSTEFWSYDRGIDPATKASLWGAIAGAYHYRKL
ncbi:MAG: chromophore lyase CpcT/CpeT [Pseudanabaenaceae cyanobacterium bins.68]|nr:chromophore lyase CpcT/CpeT [Pseudanabaenaceae cyanobacterium bins.68]